jgi:hypothetical protein
MDGSLVIKKKKDKGGIKKSDKLEVDFIERFIDEMLLKHSELVEKKTFIIKVRNEKMVYTSN